MRCWNCGRENPVMRTLNGVMSYECRYCGYGLKAQITMERDKVTDKWKPKEKQRMKVESWYGPWCNYHAELIEGGSSIVGEVHQFRRHVYEGGVFSTEKIDIEGWWKLGYSYAQLPRGSLTK